MKGLVMAGIIGFMVLDATGAKVDLIKAIVAVESGGDSKAIGDSGKAVGILQIHPIMVAECNRLSGKNYTLADRLDPQKSREMCQIFLSAAEKRIKRIEKRQPTAIELARCWNGSYDGYKLKSTVKYGNKIERAMK